MNLQKTIDAGNTGTISASNVQWKCQQEAIGYSCISLDGTKQYQSVVEIRYAAEPWTFGALGWDDVGAGAAYLLPFLLVAAVTVFFTSWIWDNNVQKKNRIIRELEDRNDQLVDLAFPTDTAQCVTQPKPKRRR